MILWNCYMAKRFYGNDVYHECTPPMLSESYLIKAPSLSEPPPIKVPCKIWF